MKNAPVHVPVGDKGSSHRSVAAIARPLVPVMVESSSVNLFVRTATRITRWWYVTKRSMLYREEVACTVCIS